MLADAATFVAADGVAEGDTDADADAATSAVADEVAKGDADAATFAVADEVAERDADADADADLDAVEELLGAAERTVDVASSGMAPCAADEDELDDGLERPAAARTGEDSRCGTTSTIAGGGGINWSSSSTRPVYGLAIFKNLMCSFESLSSPCSLGFARWRAMSRTTRLQPGTGHHFFWRPFAGFFPFLDCFFPHCW